MCIGRLMSHEVVASIRMRAELARRLATEMKERKTANALREIAEALDRDADDLEGNTVRMAGAFSPMGFDSRPPP